MNKRPHPGMGLPAKPYTPHQPGPAPPLPAGPPPTQQQQQYNDQQNAHAAAWAAYYQAQGVTSAPGYNAAPQADPSAAASNPYANYGYGAGAPHAAQAQNQNQNTGYSAPTAGGYNAGPSYRPPPQQQQQQQPQQSYASPMQQQQQQGGYNGQNYNAGAASPGGYNARPPYNNQQNQGYSGWNQQQQAPQTPQHQQQGYNNGGGYNNTPQQPYYPQSSPSGHASPSVNQPYRPAPGPQNQPNRPYQPQPGPQRSSIPPRPPAPGGQGGGPGGFPPAKRPRFDGPGGGGPGIPPRPPSQSGRNPSGPPGGGGGGGAGGGFGSGMARPMGGGGGGGGGRGGSPMSSASIPRIGFNTPPRGGGPMRGGMGRGGGPMMSGRGGGMMGAPRGPSHLRRNDLNRTPGPRQGRGVEPPRERERPGEKKRKDKTEKEARTTMTDFRIVGIEVKELGWSWGLVGEHVVDEVKVEEVKEVEAEPKADPEVKAEPEAEAETKVKTEKEAEPEAEASEAVDEKRGEKRKAKASSVDGDVESQSPKKRNSSFLSTHGKPNLSEIKPPSSESNQNRFRIYFESPPELDRVPKSARRNPNKRWRRESSSVAPSRIGETEDGHDGAEGTEAPEDGHEAAVDGEGHAEGAEPAPEAEVEAKPEDAPPADAAAEASVEAAAEPAPAAGADTAEPSAPTEPETTEPEATEPQEEAHAEGEAEQPAEPAPEAPEEPATEEPATEDVGDISMVTDAAGVAEAEVNDAEATDAKADGEGEDATKPSGLTGAEATAAEMEAALAESAQNAASAYGNRGSKQARRWSTSTTDSQTESILATLHGDVHQPSHNRVTVIYEESSRRLVFDASVVHKIRIFRGEGRIEVDLLPGAAPVVPKAESEDKKDGDKVEEKPVLELPKGVMVETYDQAEQRFIATSREKLDQLTDSDKTLPPLHKVFSGVASSNPITLTVYLNKKKPLSEPKWCRTNQADEWLYEQFGRRNGGDAGWRSKLEIVDPDAPPTLSTILDQWKNGSSSGTTADRNDFTKSLLASPNDLLEILLRLTRGERNPTASIGTGPSSANGPLATVIRPDSPYASHQTHVSLAILAMYQLTTDFAQQAGVKTEVLNEKIADIIKSLPTHMIHKSLDGLYKEWLAERKG